MAQFSAGRLLSSDPVPAQEPEPAADPDREPAPDPELGGTLDLEALRAVWPAVIDAVREQNAMLAALLDGANPIAVARDELTVAFAESAAFLKRKAEDAPNREALASAIQSVSGRVVQLVYELRPDTPPGEQRAETGQTLSDDELVARFLAEFDGEELTREESTT